MSAFQSKNVSKSSLLNRNQQEAKAIPPHSAKLTSTKPVFGEVDFGGQIPEVWT
jgi:hypothetical protein